MSFEAEDRLAVVPVNWQHQSTIQRIGTAEKISSPEFIAWLRHQNAQRYEVYHSVNSLRDSAHGRTKEEVARIQHIYLDFDKSFGEVTSPIRFATPNTGCKKAALDLGKEHR